MLGKRYVEKQVFNADETLVELVLQLCQCLLQLFWGFGANMFIIVISS